MRSLNKVQLIGNLGNDPEIRHTPGGAAVATFRMATTWTFTDQGGNRQERTEWHRIVAWRKLAEICQQYLRKGKQVYIEGRLQTREWEDKQSGQRRWTTEVVAEDMIMLGGRGEGGGSSESQEPVYAKETSGGRAERAERAGSTEPDSGYTPDSSLDPVGEDEDLPF